jgi:agarase
MWNAGPKGWMYIYRFDIVDEKPTGLNIIPDKIQIGVGQYRNLSVQLQPFEATQSSLIWQSESEETATTNGSTIRGESVGNTTVYVQNSDGSLIDSCTVIVQEERFIDNVVTVSASSFTSTGGTYNDASSGGPGFGVKKNGAGINFVNKNDWCIYNVEVPLSGVYELSYQISTPMENPEVSLEIDDKRVAQDEVFTNGAWDSYYTLKSEGIVTFNEPGFQTVKIIASGADNWQWNLQSFSFTRLYELNRTVGLDKISNFEKINVYSNPAEKRLYINGIENRYIVSIFSILGQKCYSKNHFGNSVINLDNRFSGTYLVQIVQDWNIYNTKVLL